MVILEATVMELPNREKIIFPLPKLLRVLFLRLVKVLLIFIIRESKVPDKVRGRILIFPVK